MTQNTKIHDKFEYHVEDLDCTNCKFYKRKSKKYANGCHENICHFNDIRDEAILNDRIKRKPGWFKFHL
jgi:hypothetical protein